MPEQCWEVVWGTCRLLRDDLSLFPKDRLLQTIIMTIYSQTDITAIAMLSLLPTSCQQEQGNTSWPEPQRKQLPALTALLHLTRSVNPQLLQY